MCKKMFFYKRKRLSCLLCLLVSVSGFYLYSIYDKTNQYPLFTNSENYTDKLSVMTNQIYFSGVDNYSIDKKLFIKDIKNGVSSVCNSKIYAHFYKNTRMNNNSAIAVFIISNDGRIFNFRMSKYNYGSFSKQLNAYLKTKNISC